jgi:leucyl-tRNA synthetase
MKYNFNTIEQKWNSYWKEKHTYRVTEDVSKEKFYVLDMFPYPSGAGLHVGHPLGYIASDIYARYKRLKGFNVLHPMGYDSFGLPAEQYAIETGQHPELTTQNNITRYREQLDKMGFSFDWNRELRTSDSSYYKWTQWIFKQLFQSYYCNTEDKALPISELIKELERNGNSTIESPCDEDTPLFTSKEWNNWSENKQQEILLKYRLAFLSDSWVNWCEGLGTVLANDEVKDGYSERGNFPVEQKKMKQWSLRITAYAERLLNDLDKIDWSQPIKEMQKNWIGKSRGVSINFPLDLGGSIIEVFTTRPDTIYGVSFMVISPEHELIKSLTVDEQRVVVEKYCEQAAIKTDRERQSNIKNVTGVFTGSYAVNPFSNKKIPIWVADYVLASYGTGAVMAVPCGDQRDWAFAKAFNLDIPNVFKDTDVNEGAYEDRNIVITNSKFLNGLNSSDAIKSVIKYVKERSIGYVKVNYRLRDAIFSRQRYWGEPFPIFYKNNTPYLIDGLDCVELPVVDKYLPTESGEPPLARARKEDWNIYDGDRMEYNTMPGWAGSSWYFLRYMDPNNNNEFVSKEKLKYWGQVDLYIGGAEHAVGHLLYSRFWTKFLNDRGFIDFNEPFKKLINQGMILGRSSFVYRVNGTNKFVSYDKKNEYKTSRLYVDIQYVENDILHIENFKKWRSEFTEAQFILNDDGEYLCGFEVEKMSKSKYNTQIPDDLIERFGADTLRMYEMFLGPLEQFKPWDTKGITGVDGFLKKFWRLSHDVDGDIILSDESPSDEEYKSLHHCIKKVTDDLDRFSFNTVVSALMICVNQLIELKCNKSEIIRDLTVLLCPYAPYVSEEIWSLLGNNSSISDAVWPIFNEKYLLEDSFTYPVSFNGKMRFTLNLSNAFSKDDIEEAVLSHSKTIGYLDNKNPKRVIIVPKKIINIVF